MKLIVQKFGGSSVRDAQRIQNAADIIAGTYRAGNQVLVVLSAQGNTTDDLIEKAKDINPRASKREMDMLLSTGEQISIALCAMALEGMGLPVISLTAWQVGIHTSSVYSDARIKRIDTERIQRELDKNKIVLVAGFQGVNRFGDVTTLGRGGSDTSAVALAAAFHADLCQIYTDVDGVYTTDPRIVPNARKLQEITYDEMLELASQGAQVLHNRSVELAKKYHVNMEVVSSLEHAPGTKVKEVAKVEKTTIQYCSDRPGGAGQQPGRGLPGVLRAEQSQCECGYHHPVHRPPGQQGYQLYPAPVVGGDRLPGTGGAEAGAGLRPHHSGRQDRQGVHRWRGCHDHAWRGGQDVRGSLRRQYQHPDDQYQ